MLGSQTPNEMGTKWERDEMGYEMGSDGSDDGFVRDNQDSSGTTPVRLTHGTSGMHCGILRRGNPPGLNLLVRPWFAALTSIGRRLGPLPACGTRSAQIGTLPTASHRQQTVCAASLLESDPQYVRPPARAQCTARVSVAFGQTWNRLEGRADRNAQAKNPTMPWSRESGARHASVRVNNVPWSS